jgi:hypothetical protein
MFWYAKKQNLNNVLYNSHLQTPNKVDNLWNINGNITKKTDQGQKEDMKL